MRIILIDEDVTDALEINPLTGSPWTLEEAQMQQRFAFEDGGCLTVKVVDQ